MYIYISYISKALCQKIEFFPSVDLKKFHNIKVESYVLLGVGSRGGRILRIQAREITLWKLLWGGEGWSQVIQKFCHKGQIVWTSKENQIFQVKEFSVFLYMGRCKSLAHWNHFFDTYLSYLGPVSVFSKYPEFPQGSPYAVAADWWLLDGGILSFLSSLRAHQLTIHRGYNCQWL